MRTTLLLCLLGHQGLSFAQVSLGSAAPFGALSYATVTNTGPTVIDGNVGTTGTSITGFPPGTYTGSEVTSTDAQQALDDAHSAYNQLQGLTGATTLTGDLGGRTLVPGVYTFPSSAAITGTLTLAGTGSDSDSWVFQIGSTLITAVDSSIVLTGGASACNVFWAVGSSTTLGVGTNMYGVILSLISATVNTNAISHGNIVAIGGSVTMDTNHITAIGGSCADVASSSSNTSSSSSSVTSSITTSSSAASSSSSSTTSTSASSDGGAGPGSAVNPTATTSLSSTSLTTLSTSRTPCSTTSTITSTTSITTLASTTTTPLPVPTGPSFYPGNAQYTLMGCFAEVPDNIEPNRLLNNVYTDSALTAESCLAFAAANGYKYAGLEYAQECWYGNTLNPGGVVSPWASCTSICKGNKYEYCGSGLEMVLYEVGGAVTSLTPTVLLPSSTSSASVSSSSPSSTIPGSVGILAVTSSATSPSSISVTPTSSSSGSSATTLGNKQTVGAYAFQGCYTEATTGRALSLGAFYDYTTMTIEECAASCAGYPYFGIEYGGECYCGSKLNPGSIKAPVTDCNFICPGNQYEYCGAGNRLNVYLLSSSVTTTSSAIPPTTSSTSSPSSSPSSSSSSPTSTRPSATTQNTLSGTITSCLCPVSTATSIVYSTSIIYTTMTSP